MSHSCVSLCVKMEYFTESCDCGCDCDCGWCVRDYKWWVVGLLSALSGVLMVSWVVQWSADFAPYIALDARVSANSEIISADCILAGQHVDCYYGFYNASYLLDGERVGWCRLQGTWGYKRADVESFLATNLPLGQTVPLWSQTPAEDNTCVTSVNFHRSLFIAWLVFASFVGCLLIFEAIGRILLCCHPHSGSRRRVTGRYRSFRDFGMVGAANSRNAAAVRSSRGRL